MRTNANRPLPEIPPRPTQAASPSVKPAAPATTAAKPAAPAPAAPKVGTGPLRTLGADEGANDDLLDNAVGALPQGPDAPKAKKPYAAIAQAVAGDPEAQKAMAELERMDLLEAGEDPKHPTVGDMLETAARQGKVSLVREIARNLADPSRLTTGSDRPKHPGKALAELAYQEPQAFVAASFNLARNGFAHLPGGEKVAMKPGTPATFGERLQSTGQLSSPQQKGIQAIAASRPIFYTPKAGWQLPEKSSDRRIERDAKDVNTLYGAAIGAQVRRNQLAESQRLAKWPPAQREAYEAVSDALRKEPAGRLALQNMLFEGRLPGKATNAEGDTTMTALAKLAKAPMHGDLMPDRVLSEALNEIHRPDAINQQNRGSCTMASVQIKLAKENPAEFLRLVQGLASPAGEVKLANGDAIVRESGTERPDNSNRTAPARLFQAAMMEYGNGDLDYDNTTENQEYLAKYREREGLAPDAEVDPQDLHSDGSGGMSDAAVGSVVRAIAGGRAQVRIAYGYDGAPPDVRPVMENLRNGLAKGLTVPVGLDWGGRDADGRVHGGHEVLVTRIAQGRVHYHNPWGQQESMPLAAFQERLGASIVADFANLKRQP